MRTVWGRKPWRTKLSRGRRSLRGGSSAGQPTVSVATGITTVGCRPVTGGETYDLQGRRVRQVSRPGVYIRNGRKIMVK